MSYHGRHRRDHTAARDPIDNLLLDETLDDTGDELDPERPGDAVDVTKAAQPRR